MIGAILVSAMAVCFCLGLATHEICKAIREAAPPRPFVTHRLNQPIDFGKARRAVRGPRL